MVGQYQRGCNANEQRCDGIAVAVLIGDDGGCRLAINETGEQREILKLETKRRQRRNSTAWAATHRGIAV